MNLKATTQQTANRSASPSSGRSDDGKAKVIVAKKHPATKPDKSKDTESSDVSDVSGAPLSPGCEGRPTLDDPIILESGPLLFIEEKKVVVNQIAVAAKFARKYQIVFDEVAGHFRRYNDKTGVWDPIKDAPAKLLLGEFLKTVADEYDAPALIPMRTNALLGAILSLVRGYAVMGQPPAAEGPLIHVRNGMLDLSGNKPVLRPFAAEYFSKSACAIAYNPEAKCERFLDELLRPALANPDDVALFRRYAGSVLLGANAAQRFLLLYGDAASGKSTVVTIFEKLIGLENVASLRTKHLDNRFEAHSFHGKKLLTAKDVATDFLANAGAKTIKSLVGDDHIDTELKYGGKFLLRGYFNTIVTSNARLHLPVEEDEGAWKRRLLVLNFARAKAPKRVANFAETLLATEGEGILTWMVGGAMEHLRELKAHGDFTLTAEQLARINDLILESRSHEVFVENCLKQAPKIDVTVDELVNGYLSFCKTKGWAPISLKKFRSALPDLMIRAHAAHGRHDIKRPGLCLRGYKGVALVSPEEK